jgi:hypothetical protein
MMMGTIIGGSGGLPGGGSPPGIAFSSRTTPAGGSVSTPGSGSVGPAAGAIGGLATGTELLGNVAIAGASFATAAV